MRRLLRRLVKARAEHHKLMRQKRQYSIRPNQAVMNQGRMRGGADTAAVHRHTVMKPTNAIDEAQIITARANALRATTVQAAAPLPAARGRELLAAVPTRGIDVRSSAALYNRSRCLVNLSRHLVNLSRRAVSTSSEP